MNYSEQIRIIHTEIDGVCSSISSDVDSKVTAANSLSLNIEAGSVAGDSEIDISSLNELFLAKVSKVFVHPFQQGIGQGGKFKTLSGPNALKALGEKVQESGMDATINSAVVVVITADSYQALLTKSKSLGGFFMWPELLAVSKHVEGLLDQTEYSNNSVIAATVENNNGLKESSLFSDLPSFAALATGGSEQNPIDELNEMLADKKAISDTCSTLMADIESTIPTDLIYSEAVNGSNNVSIGKAISSLTGVGHEQSHCCAVALLGESSNLNIWREVFGL